MFNQIKNLEVRTILESRRISWEFNCPRTAWHGGFFERLMRTGKETLAKTFGRSLVSFEILRTVIQEIAAVVNSRPLTFDPEDPDELLQIVPADFLGRTGGLPLSTQLPPDRNASPTPTRLLIKAARASANYSRHLARRWQKEYLKQLRSANIDNSGKNKPLNASDVALLRDEPKPRLQWQLVRVLDVHPGRDGEPRTYSVRFSNGSVSRRPAQCLCPLGVGA